MDYFSISTIVFYTLHNIFLFYQKNHRTWLLMNNDHNLLLLISASVKLGWLTSLIYFFYYGYSVKWWAPIVVFIIGMFLTPVGFLLEKLFSKYSISIFGLAGWPFCAYFMFAYIPFDHNQNELGVGRYEYNTGIDLGLGDGSQLLLIWPGWIDGAPSLVVFIILPIMLIYTLYKKTNLSTIVKIILTPICIITPISIMIILPYILVKSGFIVSLNQGITEEINYEYAAQIFGYYSDHIWSIITSIIVYFIYKYLTKNHTIK